jgi:hypothetical protein
MYPGLILASVGSEVDRPTLPFSRTLRFADCPSANDLAVWLRKMAARALILTLAFLSVATVPVLAQQALTLPRGLDQLTEEAKVIVHGSVISARIEPHPQLKNLMTAVVTMRVIDSYKGNPPKTLVFRQYLWDLRAQLGAAEYGKGQELLLLLGPVSEYGLTSPVGLEQGRFKISRDQKGQATAVNGRGNLGLFDSVEQRVRSRGVQLSPRTTSLVRKNRAGPLPLLDLEDAIRTFAGRQ